MEFRRIQDDIANLLGGTLEERNAERERFAEKIDESESQQAPFAEKREGNRAQEKIERRLAKQAAKA